jgi:hypothetical protein
MMFEFATMWMFMTALRYIDAVRAFATAAHRSTMALWYTSTPYLPKAPAWHGPSYQTLVPGQLCLVTMPCHADVPPFLARWPALPPRRSAFVETISGLFLRGSGKHVLWRLTSLDLIIDQASLSADVDGFPRSVDVTEMVTDWAPGVRTTPRELALFVFGTTTWNSLSNARLMIETQRGVEDAYVDNDTFDPTSFFRP